MLRLHRQRSVTVSLHTDSKVVSEQSLKADGSSSVIPIGQLAGQIVFTADKHAHI